MPGTVLSAINVLSHLIFTATTDQILLLPHFANEDTEVQSGSIPRSKSQSSQLTRTQVVQFGTGAPKHLAKTAALVLVFIALCIACIPLTR